MKRKNYSKVATKRLLFFGILLLPFLIGENANAEMNNQFQFYQQDFFSQKEHFKPEISNFEKKAVDVQINGGFNVYVNESFGFNLHSSSFLKNIPLFDAFSSDDNFHIAFNNSDILMGISTPFSKQEGTFSNSSYDVNTISRIPPTGFPGNPLGVPVGNGIVPFLGLILAYCLFVFFKASKLNYNRN